MLWEENWDHCMRVVHLLKKCIFQFKRYLKIKHFLLLTEVYFFKATVDLQLAPGNLNMDLLHLPQTWTHWWSKTVNCMILQKVHTEIPSVIQIFWVCQMKLNGGINNFEIVVLYLWSESIISHFIEYIIKSLVFRSLPFTPQITIITVSRPTCPT